MLTELLQTRPRVLNALHAAGLAAAATQTIPSELDCLARHARGRRCAVEIGTFQGVSAAVIARALDPAGRLYCVDPWQPVAGRENPVYAIAKRHLRRHGVIDRVVLLQQFSREAEATLPAACDFAFIDGDHSYEGLATDWQILAPRLGAGGVMCLHDTTVPQGQPQHTHGAVLYFEEVIRGDARFRHLETVHSLNVLERVL
jgi:predicted O-methyltransferase YrrM